MVRRLNIEPLTLLLFWWHRQGTQHNEPEPILRLPRVIKAFFVLHVILFLQAAPAHANPEFCDKLLTFAKANVTATKAKALDKTLDLMAAWKGLPAYLKKNEELRQTGRYLSYDNFGEMGLAEIGISVRFNQKKLDSLNTGRPLIIVANHHLGIADGLSLQYLASRSRKNATSLLFLARWIEKLLPHAVFGDEHNWGTAIPVDINTPKASDPNYETKLADINKFNTGWTRTSARVLRNGGALIVFPPGHVASMEGDGPYPESVHDAANSWQEGFLNLARIGNADIVFAHVNSVNRKFFYRFRKFFGGGDKERVIWFFSEALAKNGQTIDVELSKPMTVDEIYQALSQTYGYSEDTLKANARLTAELMRQFTYNISAAFPQELDTKETPAVKAAR